MHLRRLLALPVLTPLLVAGLLGVPTLAPAGAQALTPPGPAPVPVPPAVVELPLSGVAAERSALRAAGAARTVVLTEQRETRPFEVLGLTWDAGDVGELAVTVRTRTAGAWTPWTPVDVEAEAPEGVEGDGVRPGTEPLWVGEADGVQARVDVLSGAAPTGVRLALVDPGDSPADATAGSATALGRAQLTASASGPTIRSRAAWGADESIRKGGASYASSLKAVTLHHTASSSSYDRDDVPRLLRGFYAYHVKSNGWSDIGYNFLVDRFGTIWEGRAGGTSRAVIGAHAGGFNTSTAGVSMIGTYSATTPSSAMREAVAQITAWKLGRAGVDPRSRVTLTSAGSTRYSRGRSVSLPTVFGHLDVSTTSCPGTRGYAALPGIRERAAAIIAGAGYAPIVADPEPEPAPEPVPAQPELLTVEAPSSAASGSTVDVVVRGPVGAPVALWFARDGEGATRRRDDVIGADGTYRTSYPADATYSLFAVTGSRTSPRTTVQVSGAAAPAAVSPLSVQGPVTVEAHTPALVTVTGPAGTAVSVWFRKQGEQSYTRLREGALGADGTWTTSYVSDVAHTYFAMSSTVTSLDAATAVGPVPNGLHVTTPSTVAEGQDVPLVVSGPPGAAVDVWFARAGEPFSRRRQAVLGADGTYRTSWSASAAHTVFAATTTRTSTRVTTTVAGLPGPSATSSSPSPLAVTAPAAVDAGTPAELVVSGAPGAPVEVWFRAREAAVFTKRRSGVLDATGSFRTSWLAVEDHEVFATSGATASRDVAPAVRPVVSAPSTARLGTVVLSGRARPGDPVVVTGTRRSGGTTTARATASSAGTWRVSTALADETVWRAAAGDRSGGPAVTTTVTPTVTGPGRSGRGSVVRFAGTARPGALVELLVRRKGATAFVVARRLTADARGRFATTAALAVDHRWYVRADGRASAMGLTTIR